MLGERPRIRNCSTGWPRGSSRSGWSIKEMHRLIMLSSTYQKAATATTPRAERRSREPTYWRTERQVAKARGRGDARCAPGRRRHARPNAWAARSSGEEPRLLFRPHLEGQDRIRRATGGRSICRSSATTCTTCSSSSTSPTPPSPTATGPTTTVAPQALFMMNSDLVARSSARPRRSDS